MGIGLVAYSFKIKVRRSDESTYDNLDDVDNTDMLDYIEDFLTEYQNEYYTDDTTKKAFKVEKVNKNPNRTISGIVTYGDGGIPAQIRNIENPESIAYEKVVNDTECIPLYYLFYLPTSSNGILILEKYGSKSSKTIFNTLLKNKFKEDFPNKTIYIDLLPQKKLMDMFMTQGIIKQLTLSSFESPGKHVEDHYAHNGQDIEKIATYDFTIKANRNKHLDFLKEKINNIFNRTKNIDSISNVVAIRDFKPNQLKVVYNVGKTQKTIKLDGLDDLNATFDITEILDIQPYSHPTYEEINPVAQDYLNDLID